MLYLILAAKMDKVTGEARIALMSKKDLTNDLLDKILSWIPRDKDCKSPVVDLINGKKKKMNLISMADTFGYSGKMVI